MQVSVYQEALDEGWRVDTSGVVRDGSGSVRATSRSLSGHLRVRYRRRHIMVARLAIAERFGVEVLASKKPSFANGDRVDFSFANLLLAPRFR